MILALILFCGYLAVRAGGSSDYFSLSLDALKGQLNQDHNLETLGDEIELSIPYNTIDQKNNIYSIRKITGPLGERVPFTRSIPNLPADLSLEDMQAHGTTTMAFIHRDSIIVCVDSKASIGSYVGSRTVKKVFPVSRSIVATMAGGAADCAHFIRRVSRMLRIYQQEYDMPITTRTFAHLLAKTLKQYQSAGKSDMGLSVGTMVAGWDEQDGPSVWYVDDKASCLKGDIFCVGSGQQHAYAIIDESIRNCSVKSKEKAPVHENLLEEVDHRDYRYGTGGLRKVRPQISTSDDVQSNAEARLLDALDTDEAINTAIRAVRHATFRDGFSGGFINVLLVNQSGIHHMHRIDCASISLRDDKT